MVRTNVLVGPEAATSRSEAAQSVVSDRPGQEGLRRFVLHHATVVSVSSIARKHITSGGKAR